MRRRLLYHKNGDEPEYTSFPMDILMLNNETHKQEIMGCEEHTTKDFPKGTYTPIGIVLTPVYRGDSYDKDGWSGVNRYSGYGEDVGVMGVIALTDASLTSPEEGTTNPSEILCGNSLSYLDPVYSWHKPTAYIRLPYIDTNGTPTNDIQGDANTNFGIPDYTSNQISVATDKSDTVASPVDAWSGYANADGHKAASPYFVSEKYKDDEYNGKSGWDFEGYNEVAYDEYDVDNPDIDDISAFADYNGELNSLSILMCKSWNRGREWIENATSNSNSNSTDCPAVEACWKYAPEGTATGGWYLPALGELSLMAARFEKINETLKQLNAAYGVEVSLLKETNIPYLSSTSFYSVDLYDEVVGEFAPSELVFALFPDINGDMGINHVCTTNINGATRYGGYVRPFKKIRNEIPYGNTFNAYNFTPHYELMPAHFTKTFCDGGSGREWFGQKFIVSFRRGCLTVGIDQLGRYNYNITSKIVRIYGYRIKSGSDTTRIGDNARVLAELWVDDLESSTSSTWPTYSGDEKGLNIVGRFTTKYQFDTDGAFDEEKDDYVDMDTDEFDRDGTVEPGWYVLAGVAIYGYSAGDTSGISDWHILPNTSNYNVAVIKDEIDIVNGVESKEAFFDEIRTTPCNNYLTNLITESPFYVGQLDRPVALLFFSGEVRNDD